jgi:hypothetical protein
MKKMFVLALVFLLKLSSADAQGVFEFSFKGKTYKLSGFYACMEKNSKGEYTISLRGKGAGLESVDIFLYDAMSTMPPLHRGDPPMSVKQYTNDNNAIRGCMFSFISEDHMTAPTSDWKLSPLFTVSLTKLDMSNELVSGTFEGPTVPLAPAAKQEVLNISNGKFSDIPLKCNY